MQFNSDRFNQLERKFGKYAIKDLMTYVVIAMGVVFIMDYLPIPGLSVKSWLYFNRDLIFQGQIWRLITFAFLPPDSSLYFILFSLYFYWLIGSALQNQWGTFKFNVFYLTGMVGTILSGLITGGATNYYLNMSLFFAFAILFPNFEIMLFFILPIKIKYLAYLDGALFLYSLIVSPISQKLALIVALLNIALFFWRDFYSLINNWNRRRQFKKNWRK